jgi:methyl-accepting chemotaxis protein
MDGQPPSAAANSPNVMTEEEARAYLRKRILIKWASRIFVLGVCGVLLLLQHWLSPLGGDLQAGVEGMVGVAVGLSVADFRLIRRMQEQGSVADMVSSDLARLEQCFAILQKQVTVTIRTSEHAVMEMVERLNRVHKRSVELQTQVETAVERSRSLSQSSLNEADRNGETADTLASHQRAFVEARAENQNRIRAVVDQVRHLTPLASLIGDISRQTNLLSINASIEAARAGAEGAGFKVVAAEVRRLSAQTSEAARQITEGIKNVANSIDNELLTASELDADGTAHQLGELASHIAAISEGLSEAVPYLVNLSSSMDEGMQLMTTDIIDAMGHMQFQDINRQLLEQVESALGSLSEHSAALYALLGGKAPPPPQALEDLMQRWVSSYVMNEQRVAHAEVDKRILDWSPGSNRAAMPELAIAADAPRIEMF